MRYKQTVNSYRNLHFVVVDTTQNVFLGNKFRVGILNAMKSLTSELELLCPKKLCCRGHRTSSRSAAVTVFPVWWKRPMPEQVC